MSDVPERIPSYEVLGVPISITSLSDASSSIHKWAGDKRGRFVCVRDVHGVVQAVDNRNFKLLHHQASMVTPDGMPLVWLGQAAGHRVKRTCGPDLMDRVMRDSAHTGLGHFLFGGKEGVAEKLKSAFQTRYPGLRILGTATPPFRDLTSDELVELASDIEESGADVVWIGLSTPHQEFLMQQLVGLTPATLIGVGAAFDFHSGEIRRAPLWMQRSGVEFIHRLLSEPRRLWRRYLIMAPRFLWLICRRARHD